MTYGYFKPSVADARHEKSICGKSYGPPDRAVLQGPSGITLRASVVTLDRLRSHQQFENRIIIRQNQGLQLFENRSAIRQDHDLLYDPVEDRSGLAIVLALTIPETASLRFLSDTFLLSDGNTQTTHRYSASQVLFFPKPTVILSALLVAEFDQCIAGVAGCTPVERTPIGDTLQAPPEKKTWLGQPIERARYVVLYFTPIEDTTSGPFTLRLPAVAIDGKPYQFPAITFRYVEETVWDRLAITC